MEAWLDDELRAKAEIAIHKQGISGVRLRGGPMDGWLVKPEADALKRDWFMTWPGSVSERFDPGHYELSQSRTWAKWLEVGTSGGPTGSTPDAGHVFVSYVHDDSDKVDRLHSDLELSGLQVWRDVTNLWPGDRWRPKLREAIQKDVLAFVPCFSSATHRRARSMMFEELIWAGEEHRLRNPDRAWIFPVFFDDVPPPPIDLGSGSSLADLQWTKLFHDWDAGVARLAQALRHLFQARDPIGRDTTVDVSGRNSMPDAPEAAQHDPSQAEQRLLEIEEQRFAWELEQRQEEQERRRLSDEQAKTAAFSVSFSFRTSSEDWGRVIARNDGPADAHEVVLDVWWDQSSGRVAVDGVKGMDHGAADRLRPGQSVHRAVSFSLATPAVESMRYGLSWSDGRGDQSEEGQVPSSS